MLHQVHNRCQIDPALLLAFLGIGTMNLIPVARSD